MMIDNGESGELIMVPPLLPISKRHVSIQEQSIESSFSREKILSPSLRAGTTNLNKILTNAISSIRKVIHNEPIWNTGPFNFKSWSNDNGVKIVMVTWNLMESIPPNPKKFAKLLGAHTDPDIVVFCGQEVERSIAKSFCCPDKRDLSKLLLHALPNMHFIAEYNLFALNLSVLVKKSLSPFVSDITTNHVSSGMGGVMGNKGGILIRFKLKTNLPIDPNERSLNLDFLANNTSEPAVFSENNINGKPKSKFHESQRSSKVTPISSATFKTLDFGFIGVHLPAGQAEIKNRLVAIQKISTALIRKYFCVSSAVTPSNNSNNNSNKTEFQQEESPNLRNNKKSVTVVSNTRYCGSAYRIYSQDTSQNDIYEEELFTPLDEVKSVDNDAWRLKPNARVFILGDTNFRVHAPHTFDVDEVSGKAHIDGMDIQLYDSKEGNGNKLSKSICNNPTIKSPEKSMPPQRQKVQKMKQWRDAVLIMMKENKHIELLERDEFIAMLHILKSTQNRSLSNPATVEEKTSQQWSDSSPYSNNKSQKFNSLALMQSLPPAATASVRSLIPNRIVGNNNMSYDYQSVNLGSSRNYPQRQVKGIFNFLDGIRDARSVIQDELYQNKSSNQSIHYNEAAESIVSPFNHSIKSPVVNPEFRFSSDSDEYSKVLPSPILDTENHPTATKELTKEINTLKSNVSVRVPKSDSHEYTTKLQIHRLSSLSSQQSSSNPKDSKNILNQMLHSTSSDANIIVLNPEPIFAAAFGANNHKSQTTKISDKNQPSFEGFLRISQSFENQSSIPFDMGEVIEDEVKLSRNPGVAEDKKIDDISKDIMDFNHTRELRMPAIQVESGISSSSKQCSLSLGSSNLVTDSCNDLKISISPNSSGLKVNREYSNHNTHTFFSLNRDDHIELEDGKRISLRMSSRDDDSQSCLSLKSISTKNDTLASSYNGFYARNENKDLYHSDYNEEFSVGNRTGFNRNADVLEELQISAVIESEPKVSSSLNHLQDDYEVVDNFRLINEDEPNLDWEDPIRSQYHLPSQVVDKDSRDNEHLLNEGNKDRILLNNQVGNRSKLPDLTIDIPVKSLPDSLITKNTNVESIHKVHDSFSELFPSRVRHNSITPTTSKPTTLHELRTTLQDLKNQVEQNIFNTKAAIFAPCSSNNNIDEFNRIHQLKTDNTKNCSSTFHEETPKIPVNHRSESFYQNEKKDFIEGSSPFSPIISSQPFDFDVDTIQGAQYGKFSIVECNPKMANIIGAPTFESINQSQLNVESKLEKSSGLLNLAPTQMKISHGANNESQIIDEENPTYGGSCCFRNSKDESNNKNISINKTSSDANSRDLRYGSIFQFIKNSCGENLNDKEDRINYNNSSVLFGSKSSSLQPNFKEGKLDQVASEDDEILEDLDELLASFESILVESTLLRMRSGVDDSPRKSNQSRHTSAMNEGILNVVVQNANFFKKIREAPIMFAPTYKFDSNSDVYDTSAKLRVPSWTDRILWLSNEHECLRDEKIVCILYDSNREFRQSDHRAVVAQFEIY